MHITELRLLGFKSFVDPARAPIEQGLTGIVGPNGCGKSNLLEAVRWVMGANQRQGDARAGHGRCDLLRQRRTSSARACRSDAGARRRRRPRAGAASTRKTCSKSRAASDAALGSTYRINGKEVRAKDVQLLFADAATGANSPALVRQGQISELIAAKPENRRRILEDAAGIAGLHARRHEADLKLTRGGNQSDAARRNPRRDRRAGAELEEASAPGRALSRPGADAARNRSAAAAPALERSA